MRQITRPSTACCTMPMYISFLLSEPKYPSCCRLAELMNISHDSVNRFIQRENYTAKDLFDQAKQQLNLEGGVISVDDSVLDKKHSYQMDLVGYFWSGKHHKSVKGINLITLYYTDNQARHLPINYRIYDKTEEKTKNDYFLEMLEEVITWGVKPEFVTGDSWYSSTKNLKFIKNNELGFLFALKSNRLVSIEKGSFLPINTLDIPKDGLEVWLRDFGRVKIFRTLLKNEQRHYVIYLSNHATSTDPENTRLTDFKSSDFCKIHDTHWLIEQYHRVIKQVCHIEHFQVRKKVAIQNHVFAALLGYIQLQKMCMLDIIHNCYKLQRDLFNHVITEFIQTLVPDIINLEPEFNPFVNA
jgi:hypothetical protein